MQPLSRISLAMPESGIRRITNLAVTLPDCVRLEMGEPDFPTPPHICEAAAKAARDGFTKYTASQGLLSVREAMSAKLKRVNGLDVPPERIVATQGALSGLYTTCLSLLDPGDALMIPDPGWPNWAMMAQAVGASVIRYPTPKADAFLPTPETLDALVTPRTKAILLNSPCNPTGAVMPGELIARMLDFARRHDLWVISDECYDECVFDGEHVSPATLDADGRVISLFSCSKTYAMTGWRVGYVAAPPGAIGVLAKMQQPVLGNICSVAQKAAEAALTGPQDAVAMMRDPHGPAGARGHPAPPHPPPPRPRRSPAARGGDACRAARRGLLCDGRRLGRDRRHLCLRPRSPERAAGVGGAGRDLRARRARLGARGALRLRGRHPRGAGADH